MKIKAVMFSRTKEGLKEEEKIFLINQKNVSLRKATRDKKTIFCLSDFPALRKDWNGVLLKQTTLAGVQQQPQYLTAFDGGQYGAAMADVQMMSSDGVTFLMNKLYLVSASLMIKNIFDEIIPTLDDGAVVLIQTNIHSDELKYLVQFIMFGRVSVSDPPLTIEISNRVQT